MIDYVNNNYEKKLNRENINDIQNISDKLCNNEFHNIDMLNNNENVKSKLCNIENNIDKKLKSNTYICGYCYQKFYKKTNYDKHIKTSKICQAICQNTTFVPEIKNEQKLINNKIELEFKKIDDELCELKNDQNTINYWKLLIDKKINKLLLTVENQQKIIDQQQKIINQQQQILMKKIGSENLNMSHEI